MEPHLLGHHGREDLLEEIAGDEDNGRSHLLRQVMLTVWAGIDGCDECQRQGMRNLAMSGAGTMVSLAFAAGNGAGMPAGVDPALLVEMGVDPESASHLLENVLLEDRLAWVQESMERLVRKHRRSKCRCCKPSEVERAMKWRRGRPGYVPRPGQRLREKSADR